MLTQFELTQLWNYRTDRYQDALIERTFNGVSAHITIHRWLEAA